MCACYVINQLSSTGSLRTLRLSNSIADFEAAVSVKFPTFRLQSIVTTLETSLKAVVWVNTLGQ